MKATVRLHPETLYARRHNDAAMIVRVENPGGTRWVEADVHIPEKLSLASDTHLRKGRVRVGIMEKGEALEKSIRIYASEYTDAQLYNCKIIVFSYDKDGVIDERFDVPFTVKCEEQKPSVL